MAKKQTEILVAQRSLACMDQAALACCTLENPFGQGKCCGCVNNSHTYIAIG